MNRKPSVILVALAALPFFQACSKGSGSSGGSGYTISASVNGANWSGNYVLDTPRHLDVTGGLEDGIYVFVGANLADKDTSIIAIAFKADIAVNTPVACSDPDSVAIVYATSFDEYLADPPVAGSGTITITSIDQTNMVVSGTFSGSLSDANGVTLPVTGGTFRSYYQNLYTPPTPPGIKMAIRRWKQGSTGGLR